MSFCNSINALHPFNFRHARCTLSDGQFQEETDLVLKKGKVVIELPYIFAIRRMSS